MGRKRWIVGGGCAVAAAAMGVWITSWTSGEASEGAEPRHAGAATTQAVRDPKWAAPMTVAGVGNLHRITGSLYRSEQPTAEGMRNLEKLGIKTVLSLRAFHSDEDEVEKTHLSTERIYIKTWHIEDEDVVKFLKIVTDPAKQPVLVHCQHGADRTGTMCAAYRVVVQGWSKDEAIREMTDGGYGLHQIWTNLKPWIQAMDVEGLRAKAGIKMSATQPGQ
jgi:protein tyrosine phosphatase (PTP) superfamily phosphohydrolase (DUF442 family)